VREHAALRRPGGPRRVDDGGDILGPDGPHALIDRLVAHPLAALAQILQRRLALAGAGESDDLT
jgi:hypothetical protein